MVYHASPVIAEENVVFLLHMILMDSDTHHAMCFGHTVVGIETGCDVLPKRSLNLIIK